MEREVALCAPPDMLDRNVEPELGIEGKSNGDAMERCWPSWGIDGFRNVSKGDGGQMDIGGIQGVNPGPWTFFEMIKPLALPLRSTGMACACLRLWQGKCLRASMNHMRLEAEESAANACMQMAGAYKTWSNVGHVLPRAWPCCLSWCRCCWA